MTARNEIFVTNTNDFDYQDRFDGQDYYFPRGERVTVPMIAAQHMFGLGRADKTENLVRAGWANTSDGVQKLARFVFTEGVMVERPVDDTAPVTTVDGELQPA